MPINIVCTKAAGRFVEGVTYVASKKTYVEGYSVRPVECDFVTFVFGAHMGDDFTVTESDGVAHFEKVKSCCEITEEERKLLLDGHYTPEELWGGPKPTCPKCCGK